MDVRYWGPGLTIILAMIKCWLSPSLGGRGRDLLASGQSKGCKFQDERERL